MEYSDYITECRIQDLLYKFVPHLLLLLILPTDSSFLYNDKSIKPVCNNFKFKIQRKPLPKHLNIISHKWLNLHW